MMETDMGAKGSGMVRYLWLILMMVCLAAPVRAAPAPAADLMPPASLIDDLDIKGLKAGKYYYYFAAGWRNSGDAIEVPVIVVMGRKPGKRLLLTAAVHGDELNGIRVIHQVMAGLDPAELTGTVIAVPGVNQPGLNANSRYYVGSGGGGFMVDLNREFPGRNQGGGTVELYAGRLWQGLFKGRADLVVDLHTQTQGTAYPLFVFADFSNATAQAMAFDLMPDIIKNDPGQKGTLETSFLEAGIPAVTFEIGAPKQFQEDMVGRAILGIKNMMTHQGMLKGSVIQPLRAPFVGTDYTNIYTETGGVAVLAVALNDQVSKGQLVATLYDPFGRKIADYMAPHGGRILAVATDPLREAGAMLVRILK